MARTLKSSGLALNLVTCLGVDDDNTTVKDFTGKAVTKHASVTVGTASWKGTTYPYFQTGSASSTSPIGVTYDTPPTVAGNDADGFSAFAVVAGMDAATGSSVKTLINIDLTASPNLRGFHSRNGSGGAQLGMNAGAIGSTVLPSDLTTKFSFGANFKYNENSSEVFYGLESGSLASDSATSTPASGDASNFVVNQVGGYSGQNTQPGKYHLVMVFNRKLTLAEFQSLHNDPYGTLFEASAPSIVLTPDPTTVVAGGTRTFTITRSVAAGVGGVTYNLLSSNTGVATVPATATILEGNTSITFNATGVSAGSATISATNAADSGETDSAALTVSAVKGLSITTGQTSLSGLTFAWFDEASPDLFGAPSVVGTTESTDGSGVLSITLTGTSLGVGDTGWLLVYKAGATAPDDIAFFGRLVVQDIG